MAYLSESSYRPWAASCVNPDSPDPWLTRGWPVTSGRVEVMRPARRGFSQRKKPLLGAQGSEATLLARDQMTHVPRSCLSAVHSLVTSTEFRGSAAVCHHYLSH